MPSGVPGVPAAAMQQALEEAGRNIDRKLQDDTTYPDLSELLSVPAHNSPTVSGTSEMDYPLQEPGLLSIPSLPELNATPRVPLPAELLEQFSHMKCSCLMGVFPEISRAWLTMDNDIYMWNYEDGGDVDYFDGLSDTILAVGLVRPKGGVVPPHIHYLLVLATPVDIVILGLRVTTLQAGGIQLLPNPLYALPTDNTSLLTITSTNHGRIFLSGKDGCLYEVAYQAETGWFRQRCRKINHSKSSFSFLIPSVLQFTFSKDDPIVQIAIDNSRNILYTRSDKGVLQVYDLGDDGHRMCRVASVSQNSIVSAARNIARTIDRSVFKPIVQIAVIEKHESVNCHLLAVTHAGVRLYFSTMPFKQPAARPSTLSLLHVRLPPGFTASSTMEKPAKVHKAININGMLLMTASENEDSDILWCINHHLFPFKKPMMETHLTVRVDGHTWALSEIDELTPLNREIIPITDSPTLNQRHLLPPKKFVLLSAHGSHIFYIPRPVDQLRHLLVISAGGDEKEIERFFKFQQLDQACATCLVLACSSAASDSKVSVWAARAFFRYGGEAQLRIQSSIPTPSNVGPMFGSPEPITSTMPNPSFLTSPERGVYPVYPAGTPVHQSANSLPGIMGPEIVFSGKHNGICIYISRIIGNIWDGSMAVEKIFMSGNRAVTAMDSSVAPQTLESVLQELKGLLEFLDKNSQFPAGSLGNSSFGTPTNHQHRLITLGRLNMGSSQQAQQELQRKYTEAQLAETISLQGIHQLVRKMCQALSLWKLLCDHQFSLIVSQLQKELQEQLKITSFKYLVIRDKELTGALITSLINCYIQDKATVDGISSHLQEVCPLLYSADDVVCTKANALLQRSRQVQSKLEKERMLRESSKEYQKISQQVDLSYVCAQYKQVRFYEGIMDLCLTAAEKKDPQGLGLHFFKNGKPKEDTVGRHAFQQRINSYKCITDTLQELVDQSKAAPQPPSVLKKPGLPVLSSDTKMLSNEEAGIYFEKMLKLAQRSSDELFNIGVFNWLIQEDLTDKLLKFNSPFLEPYLVRMAKDDQNKDYMDLLSKYYKRNQNFSSAARVVAKLADMDNTEISLKQRLVYLSRAILSAKSSSVMSTLAANSNSTLAADSNSTLAAESNFLAILSAKSSSVMSTLAADSNSTLAAESNFLHELEDKREVALIQLKIQETLKQQYYHHSSAQDAVSQLDSQLMDITKLYCEFADPFKLSECKLAIIHCAWHSDPILVQTLWQEIIERELSKGKTMNPADRMQDLNLKLTSLGKIYVHTPQYFPLKFLVKFLEQKACSLSWDVGFVTNTMQEIGVPIPKLLEVYNYLLKARDPCWDSMKKPQHLLDCINILQSLPVQDTKVPSCKRQRFSTI